MYDIIEHKMTFFLNAIEQMCRRIKGMRNTKENLDDQV